jgi:hypothetical protein
MRKIGVNRAGIVIILLVILQSKPWACGTTSQETTPKMPQAAGAPFAGSYELTLGRWWPWSFGEETSLVTPPRRVKLLLERGSRGFEKNQLLLRAIPGQGTEAGRGGPSFWRAGPSGRIDLVWTDGFTGVTIGLTGREDVMRGWAYPHFDSPKLIPRFARVVARRIPCSQ